MFDVEIAKERIVRLMKAVCAGCDGEVPMDCFNMHTSSIPCEAIRYREVLTIVFKEPWPAFPKKKEDK